MTAPSRISRLDATLRGLERRSGARTLEPRSGLDFASNDYLGLAGSQRLQTAAAEALARGVPVGSAGSRLLRGNHPEHEMLEAEAAAFFRAPRALFFGSGFAANLALFATLPQRGDLVVRDALVHASVHDGLRDTKAAVAIMPHSDAGAAEDVIRAWRRSGGRGTPWIAVESVYSMDGDRAPLADLLAIAERHDGFLVVDEAHATGVFGPDGRGLTAGFERHEAMIALHTCGKALGASGALVTAHPAVIAMLVNRARAFIYATAPSPLVAATVRVALRILADEPERRARLEGLVATACAAFQGVTGVRPSGTQIQPVILGSNKRASGVASRLRVLGFDCRAIRPPTVPEGTARLRISLTLNVGLQDVRDLAGALADVSA